jgi:hypothetical protein
VKTLAIFLAVLTLQVLAVLAADAPPAFKEAAALYDAGHYDQAVLRYESLRGAGLASANLYFNLGNACFKAGQLGRAVLHYERARRLEPRDPDILGNLRFARNESRSPDAKATGFWIWAAALRDYLTTGEWTLMATAGYWLAAAAVIASLWLPSTPQWAGAKRWLRAPALAFAMLAVIGSAGLGAKAAVETGSPAAIVVVKEVVVRFAPVDDAPRHFTAYEGQKLWITGERESSIVGVTGWLEVERADGNKGWVPANTVEKI